MKNAIVSKVFVSKVSVSTGSVTRASASKIAAASVAAAIAVSAAFTSPVTAAEKARAYEGVASARSAAQVESADAERARWDNSGTVGRADLGADPRRPEGSGAMSH